MGDDTARFEALIGVMGAVQSSSGQPLNLLSYDLGVSEARLKLAVLGRVGVFRESLDDFRGGEAVVAVKEGIFPPKVSKFAGGLRSEKPSRLEREPCRECVVRVVLGDGLLNTEFVSLSFVGDGEDLADLSCA